MQPFFPRSLPIGWFAGTTGARCSPSPASCTAPVSGRRNVRTAYRAQVGTPYTAYSSNLSVEYVPIFKQYATDTMTK